MKAFLGSRAGNYLQLTKPERTLTNVLTAIAGYLFASQWQIEWAVFAALISGTALVIASACVLNNYTDRDIDARMARTKKRVLVAGLVPMRSAVIFAAVLAIAGFWLLTFTNLLTVAVIAAGYVGYVAVYGLAKRRTVHSTLIGTLPGGVSLVAGYTAVSGKLDAAALILFLIMLSWQMVHFYAIAIYRLKDYAAAKIPVLPAKKGIGAAKRQTVFYLVGFVFAASLLKWAGYTGYSYLVIVLILGAVWLYKGVYGLQTDQNDAWAKDMFKFSLVVLLVTMAAISLGPILP